MVNRYIWTHRNKSGKILSRVEVHNLITSEGFAFAIDQYFLTLTPYTAMWYFGLMTDTGIFGDDTAARITTGVPNPPTTNGWQEYINYSEATRPQTTFGVAASQEILGTNMVFTFTETVTIFGGFFVTDPTKGGTDGIIFSEELYNLPTGLLVNSGDTITVAPLMSIEAAT